MKVYDNTPHNTWVYVTGYPIINGLHFKSVSLSNPSGFKLFKFKLLILLFYSCCPTETQTDYINLSSGLVTILL